MKRYRIYGMGLMLLILLAGCASASGKSSSVKSDPQSAVYPDAWTKGTVQIDENLLRQKLSPMQYSVARQDGTEPPFNNEYWNNEVPGIYADIVTGVPLFSSTDKFDSGTGWPSFTKPIDPKAVVEKVDSSFGMVRTEVRGKLSNSHLGHVFNDGPAPTGLRYCMNSAAMIFIPATALKERGYGDYLRLFSK